MANEIVKKENTALTYGASADLGEIFAEELDGLTPAFERIKIPAGGGLAYEVPGDDPDSPDSVKEFKAVILYHHPISCYYKEEYTGGNNPPDCGSMDGCIGIEAESEKSGSAPTVSSINSAVARTGQKRASRREESTFFVKARLCRLFSRSRRAVLPNSVST